MENQNVHENHKFIYRIKICKEEVRYYICANGDDFRSRLFLL